MTNPAPGFLNISSVERETGLSKDTLRVWERRYQFPQPLRDAAGERLYPAEQVEKLQLIKNLMDRGQRPGKLVREDAQTLRRRAAAASTESEASAGLSRFIDLCKAHRGEELRRELSQSVLRVGMHRFVTEVLAPLNTLVGSEWASGRLAVFEEHLYTESVQSVMRRAIGSIPQSGAEDAPARPCIVLTTIPGELHTLGLVMAEALFALEGARCVPLGAQMPVSEIVRACAAHDADILALSFSASARAATVTQALVDLRAGLPAQVEIWTGGRCAALTRPAAPVWHLELEHIPGALAEWRSRFPAS
ncbi:MerR family transcriptional regulator [Noviherbaspirillum sp.]|uniref:MerR family transcriptional regulator n=1 Tax=Noviherbaspirillum sp. TaxID=1926288 RepID=UPI002D549E1E|nr:MerR family transcriptional regulator [Noviherbaspirillum sp.]HZW23598.1 MerR family transcriptional regulator [Noviherbaspirillum sp.]